MSLSSKIKFTSHEVRFVFSDKTATIKWIEQAVIKEKFSIHNIQFIFCSDKYLLEINNKFLSHDYLTDIITFDYSDKKVKEISGEIYISIDRVKVNAKEFSVPFKQELKRVIIHGILHLCGYRDKKESDKKVMRGKEDFYLKSFIT